MDETREYGLGLICNRREGEHERTNDQRNETYSSKVYDLWLQIAFSLVWLVRTAG